MYGRDDFGTFSIVACDARRRFWGVAVSTKPMAVGAVVPWAEWRVGAIATQAQSNFRYGPDGLALLRTGTSAAQVVRRLTDPDPRREHRQLAVVDRRGRSAAWTGSKCLESATHVLGDGFSCQGNLVASEEVVRSMARTFQSQRGSLVRRLLQALQAGHRAGGDRRGISSAALLVTHRRPGLDPAWGDRYVDVRVDEHPRPIRELARLADLEERAALRVLAGVAARRRRTSGVDPRKARAATRTRR